MDTRGRSIAIRDATAEDSKAIADLHADSWRSAYRGVLTNNYLENHVRQERLAFWQERFLGKDQKPMFVILGETGDAVVGFICLFPEQDAIFGSFIDNLHVTPQLTGHGIGRLLLSEVAQRLLKDGSRGGLYLWVIEQNIRARRFYERAGATVAGSAVNLMPDGQQVVAVRCYWNSPERLLAMR